MIRGAYDGNFNNNTETHVDEAASQKTKWKRFWSSCWCFRSLKSIKRVKHAAIIPETIAPQPDTVATENPIQTPYFTLPFAAPPSSPASYLPSEPPSSTHSPTGSLSLSSIAAHMYSPSGPESIFAIGPYAHETQLVTPPTFSTYTTEPSTAPFTPPPESVHLTTPSSPEVPFARLVDPIQQRGGRSQRFPMSQYDFQPYLLHPGSPVSNLISPCSGISASGTSSPFPEYELGSGNHYLLEFRTGDHSKLLNLEKMSREWESRQGSGTITPDYPHYEIDPHTNQYHGWRQNEIAVDPRVSFEINAENMNQDDGDVPNGHELRANNNLVISDEENSTHHKKQGSITLSPAKEFNFGNVDGGNIENSISSSDWWANEKVLGNDAGTSKNWSFFTVTQPGVS